MPETTLRDDGTAIATTRRRSALPAITLVKADSTSAKAKAVDTTPVKDDPTSPVTSARSLRSAKRDSVASPVRPTNSVPTTQAQSTSGTSLQSQAIEDVPSTRTTRFSTKQQHQVPPESDIIVARRRSLREPPANPNPMDNGSIDEVRVFRQSARRKSNVDHVMEEQSEEEKLEENSFSTINKRRSARHVSTKEAEPSKQDDASLSPTATRSLRSFSKTKSVTTQKVSSRRDGSMFIITGIKTWPEERLSTLKLKLKAADTANGEGSSDSSRKRRRPNGDTAVKNEENEESPRKRIKEKEGSVHNGQRFQRKSGGKIEGSKENDLVQPLHNGTDEDESVLDDSLEVVEDDEKDSRANRAARRNAKSEQNTLSQPEDAPSSPSKNNEPLGSQDKPEEHADTGKKADNETLPPLVSPNCLPAESLPPMFLDFPEKPLPETAFVDKAAYLHAKRYRPLPPLARFTAALLSHPPSSRSTETLLALAANTQRALQAYQDEYIELDLKTSRVSGTIPKKPATGGRQVMDEIKWQAEKEKELFGEGSILAPLRKTAVDTTNKRHKERKARRGEVDMLAAGLAPGKPAGAVPKLNVSDADEVAERGRAQRSRKPVKRFEDAIADAERAPSKRRKKNLDSLADSVRSSAPPAVAIDQKAGGSAGDKSKPGTDNEDEEEEGLIKPKWNNPQRPQSSMAKTAPSKQPATKVATSTTQVLAPPQVAETQQLPQYPPPYPPAVIPGYPVAYGYPPPGAYYTPYAGHYPGHPMPAPPPGVRPEHYYAHPPPPLPHYYHPAIAPPGHHPHPQHMHPHPHYAQHPLAQSTLPPQSQPHNPSHSYAYPQAQAPNPSGPPDHGPSTSTSQPRGQLPGSKDRRKPNTSGTSANGTGTGSSTGSTSRSRKEPHEKSELRSASMTKWWAERKVKIAAQKEQEKRDAEAAAAAGAKAEEAEGTEEAKKKKKVDTDREKAAEEKA